MRYHEVTIVRSPSGFGAFQASTEAPSEPNIYDCSDDLISEMADGARPDMLIRLGSREAEFRGLEDIRGRIHNEPAYVYALVGADSGLTLAWVGVAEIA